MDRYSEITNKNQREIVLLKAFPCVWGKCSFCDYILDNSNFEDEINKLNFEVLENITGKYKVLEVINSGSCFELPKATLSKIKEIIKEKKIEKLFAKNVSGEKFEKQLDKFLEFYSETIKDGTLDKDSILMRVTGSQDRNLYRIMDSGVKITKGNQTYYIYMEVVTADKEHPENKGIQIIDLATKKAYNDRYFLWHSKQGIYTQEKSCEDYQTMLIYGNLREYYPVDRELSAQYFTDFIKRSTDYKELQAEIGKPNGELTEDEIFVFEITQGVDEKTYVTCETCGDEIIRIKLVNEEEVLETIYEKDLEND